uniref:Small ribosomal subunit protein uS2c n=2 Tax=Ignatiaceae TaxID=2682551 RepID=A0A1W6EGU6_9CHLO|nr:ribosomal protein S2 [Pseudocharacium americanum]YP_009367660.1 ribosomal protein S2 [Ignatius tetrasporus]ARK14611.1 ribosomal protein S2 [Pseudocharacium americanum]ARK14700.1 ribosomal protein S2 [Ignatius tetrasporus]
MILLYIVLIRRRVIMTLSLEKMVQVGMHLGHESRKWNPKMKPYIYGQRNGIHIIDLVQTYSHLKYILDFLTESASKGQKFLFVGTKKHISKLIAKAATQCDSFFVNEKWLGGMLTNWKTIRSSLKKLTELEIQEQKNQFEDLPKKEAALRRKEKERLQKYLGGLKNMHSIPDVVIIVGQQEEMNAVQECNKLGIRSLTILDTDCDPTIADLFIPANDDSVSSVKYILTECIYAIKKGQKKLNEKIQTEKNFLNQNKNRRKKSLKTV